MEVGAGFPVHHGGQLLRYTAHCGSTRRRSAGARRRPCLRRRRRGGHEFGRVGFDGWAGCQGGACPHRALPHAEPFDGNSLNAADRICHMSLVGLAVLVDDEAHDLNHVLCFCVTIS